MAGFCDWRIPGPGGTARAAGNYAWAAGSGGLGINYGENLGTSITVSGTVGAAMEGAAMGVPALAVSLQLAGTDYLSYSQQDFTTAGYFTYLFAKMMLEKSFPPDVDLLKLEVPTGATQNTPWRMTRLARHRYYLPFAERTGKWEEPYLMEGRPQVSREEVAPDTDIYTVVFDQLVSVTPLSLDMTSRVDLQALEAHLKR